MFAKSPNGDDWKKLLQLKGENQDIIFFRQTVLFQHMCEIIDSCTFSDLHCCPQLKNIQFMGPCLCRLG